MKRKYPAYIIDRSRRSEASRFADDFVVCTDKELGFIARVYKIPRSRFDAFCEMYDALPIEEQERRFVFYTIRDGEAHMVMEIERMLYEPVTNWSRVKPLLKKAMKAYLYGEIEEIRGEGKDIDLQISAVKTLYNTMLSQRERMIDFNGEHATDNYIKSTERAIESLKLLKQILNNGRG